VTTQLQSTNTYHTEKDVRIPHSVTGAAASVTEKSVFDHLQEKAIPVRSPNQPSTSSLFLFHYRVYKCRPPAPIMSQINPANDLHPTSWKYILILSSHLCIGFSSGLCLRFPHQKTVCTSPLPHTCYMLRPSHS